WRCFTTKLPKPRISMRSPRTSASVMVSKTALTTTSASRLASWGKPLPTSSIRSRLVIPIVDERPLCALPLVFVADRQAFRRQHVREGEARFVALAAQVGVDLFALLRAAERLDREPDALLARVDLRHLGLDLVADRVERRGAIDPF